MIAEPTTIAAVPLRRTARLLALSWLIVPLIVGVAFFFFFTTTQAEGTPSSVRITPQAAPQQRAVPRGTQTISGSAWGVNWVLAPRAHYTIAARVVGSNGYLLDYLWPTSSLDLALAWGPMSDPTVDRWVDWSQSGRWYYFRIAGGAPYTPNDIYLHSANVHIIPANANLDAALRQVQAGDTVLLEGLLVDYTKGSGQSAIRSRTSLTRSDTGAGACEILYVQRLVVGGESSPCVESHPVT